MARGDGSGRRRGARLPATNNPGAAGSRRGAMAAQARARRKAPDTVTRPTQATTWSASSDAPPGRSGASARPRAREARPAPSRYFEPRSLRRPALMTSDAAARALPPAPGRNRAAPAARQPERGCRRPRRRRPRRRRRGPASRGGSRRRVAVHPRSPAVARPCGQRRRRCAPWPGTGAGAASRGRPAPRPSASQPGLGAGRAAGIRSTRARSVARPAAHAPAQPGGEHGPSTPSGTGEGSRQRLAAPSPAAAATDKGSVPHRTRRGPGRRTHSRAGPRPTTIQVGVEGHGGGPRGRAQRGQARASVRRGRRAWPRRPTRPGALRSAASSCLAAHASDTTMGAQRRTRARRRPAVARTQRCVCTARQAQRAGARGAAAATSGTPSRQPSDLRQPAGVAGPPRATTEALTRGSRRWSGRCRGRRTGPACRVVVVGVHVPRAQHRPPAVPGTRASGRSQFAARARPTGTKGPARARR